VTWFKRHREECDKAQEFRQKASDSLEEAKSKTDQVDSVQQEAHATARHLDSFAQEVTLALRRRRRLS
jgi:ElaB/YqjD/DUF883 family membrane-anchored ribosome-binding protein